MTLNAAILTARTFILAIVLFGSATFAVGQIAGGLNDTTNVNHGGNNWVVGTVFAPDGLPITAKMNIRLTSPQWGDVLALTDDTGKFVFSNVGAGTYIVVIDEKEFEPINQPVDITVARARVPETYMMTIRLKYKDKSKVKGNKPAVVNAANAGVPQPALGLYEKAAKLVGANDLRAAIKELKLAVDAYPNFANAYNQMGVLYLQLNELKEADEAFKAALKITPDSFAPLLNRGITLFRLSQYKEAATILVAALKAESNSAVAYYYLGRSLNKLGEDAKAEIAFLQSIKLSPGEFKEAHRFLAVIYLDQGNAPRVIEHLETYLRLVPQASDAASLQSVLTKLKSSTPAPAANRPKK